MKKYFYTALFLMVGTYCFGQQSECKVLIPELTGTYTGECKKGLAHGDGVAQGIDHYEGHFFKGKPDGKGLYRWANGSFYEGEFKNGMREGEGKLVKGDSVITGYWKDNKYEGKKPMPSYKITTTRNVARSVIAKSTEPGNGVKIKLMLGGNDNSEVDDLTFSYTSGSEYRNVNIYGLQNTTPPVDVTVRYHTWNQLHSVQYEVLFEFTILAAGTWNVTLTNM